jgi:hypothetical protein
VHGLKHDGKLFRSHAEWTRRAARINSALHRFGASGFRAPLTHRQPEWMQDLETDYDLSFFDTDPYEPMPGGTMSIWPFQLGHFLELPYTLAQDYTLTSVLGEETPRLWLEKVDFLRKYRGMALLNSHPDYLRDGGTWAVYVDFLETMKETGGYWHALPWQVARWWQERAGSSSVPNEQTRSGHRSSAALPDVEQGEIRLEAGVVVVRPWAGHQVEAKRKPAMAVADAAAAGQGEMLKPGMPR